MFLHESCILFNGKKSNDQANIIIGNHYHIMVFLNSSIYKMRFCEQSSNCWLISSNSIKPSHLFMSELRLEILCQYTLNSFIIDWTFMALIIFYLNINYLWNFTQHVLILGFQRKKSVMARMGIKVHMVTWSHIHLHNQVNNKELYSSSSSISFWAHHFHPPTSKFGGIY